MATLQNRNGSFRVLFVFRGRRETFTLGPVPRPVTEAKAAKVDELFTLLAGGYVSLAAGQSVVDFMRADGKAPAAIPDGAPPPERVTLGRLRDEYLTAHRGSLEENTLDGIEAHFRHLVATFGESFPPSDLSLAKLQEHADRRSKMKTRKKTPVSPVTVRKDFVAFRAAWNWGVGMGLAAGPFPALKRVRLAKADEKPPFQTRVEVERRIVLGGLTGAEADALWE